MTLSPSPGSPKARKALERKTPLRSDPEQVRAWQSRSQQATARARKPRLISPASPGQREAVQGRCCVHCGAGGKCDPAHLTPRSLGGCDDVLCVIALCRVCHVGLDRREGPMHDIDLLPVLALREFAAERAHMASHLTFHQCLRRLSGEPWRPNPVKAT